MAMKAAAPFDAKALLAKVGDGRSIDKYRQHFVGPGDPYTGNVFGVETRR